MLFKIRLKNSDKHVLLCDKGYEALMSNKYFQAINLIDKLREHSNGYAVYQRSITTKKGPVYETIYLHKHIAQTFSVKPDTDKKLFVRFINGNVLDCKVDNLEWLTMADLRRNMKNYKSRSGYRGVTQEKDKYRATIYFERKPINLGSFETADEAAKAYNDKSIELFGHSKSLNKIGKREYSRH